MPTRRATQAIEASLLEMGLKRTGSRLAVMRIFERSDRPISIQEVAERIPRGTADQATVYRIVKTLVLHGVVREVNLRHDHIDYELATAQDHHHIVCSECGKIENFEGCGAKTLVDKVLKKSRSFKTVNEHAIELFGVCNDCARKK